MLIRKADDEDSSDEGDDDGATVTADVDTEDQDDQDNDSAATGLTVMKLIFFIKNIVGFHRVPLINQLEQTCEEWPVQKCRLEKRTVKKVHPDTACRKIPREVSHFPA